MARAEGYREFLDRVHRTDVEQGTGSHKPGHCKICDEMRKDSDDVLTGDDGPDGALDPGGNGQEV